jgi:hypothetical protein
MVEMLNAYRILIGKPKGRGQLVDLGIDGKVILGWILGKWGGKVWAGCIWFRIGKNGRLL